MNIFIFENYTLKYLWVKKHNVCNLLLYGSEKNKMYIERERKEERSERGKGCFSPYSAEELSRAESHSLLGGQ